MTRASLKGKETFQVTLSTKLIKSNSPSPRLPSDAKAKLLTKEMGFNLSKTFENHLKRLVSHVDSAYGQSNSHG